MLHEEKFSTFSLFALLIGSSGGLLFGYNTTVASGILDHLKTFFTLSTFQEEILISLLILGGLAGALIAGWAADRYGRKKVLFATSLIFIAGNLIMAATSSYGIFLEGRFFTGIAVGLTSVVAPLYLAEISPPNYRGRFVSIFQLMVAAGILLAFGMNLLFAEKYSWRLVLYIGLIPAILQFLCLFFIPETPGWLMRDKKNKFAIETLDHLREDEEWREHLGEMKQTAAGKKAGKFPLFLQPHIRRIFFIGLFLGIFQQITGINTVFYYAPRIFSESASVSPQASLLATFVAGALSFITTFFAVCFLDKIGRRILLLIGIFGMIIGQALLSFSFASAIAAMIGVMIFVISFAIGLGPVTWVVLSEIFPLKIRGKAIGFVLFANWLSNYIISLTFLTLVGAIGTSATFFVYGLLSFTALLFTYFFIPETKGKSLEEIEFMVTQGKL